MAIEIRSNLVPKPGFSTFVVEDTFFKGGMRVVLTKNARDAIPLDSRKIGMLVYVVELDAYFRLKADRTTWIDFSTWQKQNYVYGSGSGTGSGVGGIATSLAMIQGAGLTTISQSLFAANSLGVFDFENNQEAPNFVVGHDTDFMGLNLSSNGGDKLSQLGWGGKNGTTNLYIRTRPSLVSPWAAWSIINVTNMAAAGNSIDNTISISRTAHGFVVGHVLAVDPSTGAFIPARADVSTTAEVVGIVIAVPNVNEFILCTNGFISGTYADLTPGAVYYLSAIAAGTLTTTAPTVIGHVHKPLFVATSVANGFFINYRGIMISTQELDVSVLNLDTANIVALTKLLVLENNSGALHPMIQVKDNTGKNRYDIGITTDPSNITFDFTGIASPTGIWRATVVA